MTLKNTLSSPVHRQKKALEISNSEQDGGFVVKIDRRNLLLTTLAHHYISGGDEQPMTKQPEA
jgi:hypothetical protein